MARKYVFADESGNFDFTNSASASKYFILTTITLDDCKVGDDLIALRRELAWQNRGLDSEFHATTDSQEIRDRVYAVLGVHAFRLDATILEKCKAQPQTRVSSERFYKVAWFYHFKHVASQIAGSQDQLLVVGASLGTKKKRKSFHEAVEDVVRQTSRSLDCRCASWAATSDPCLQVADYCSWAIQRKWELGDARSYDLIADKISSEFDLWRSGQTRYY
jgi:hypothetical protein